MKTTTLPGWLITLGTGSLLAGALMGCATRDTRAPWYRFGFSPPKAPAIQVRPAKKSAESYYRSGLFYQERQEYALAADSYREAVRIDGSFMAAYNGLGVCSDRRQHFPEAVTAYQEAIRLRYDRDELHNNLGYSLLLQGDFDGAIESFTTAIALSPVNNRRYANNLGLAYTKKGRYGEAYRAMVTVGQEEKARRTVIALAPSPKSAEEFFLAAALALEPENTYLSAGMAGPGPGIVAPAGPSAALAPTTEETNTPPLVLAPAPPEATANNSDRSSPPRAPEGSEQIPRPQPPGEKSAATVREPPLPVAEAARSPLANREKLPQEQNPPGDLSAPPAREGGDKAAPAAAPQPLTVALRATKDNRGVAANLGKFLDHRQIKTRLLAGQATYRGPTIIYFGNESLQEAYRLALLIPGLQVMEQNDTLRPNTLRVVVGDDMTPYFHARPDPFL